MRLNVDVLKARKKVLRPFIDDLQIERWRRLSDDEKEDFAEQFYLAELRRYADSHDGLAPTIAEWGRAADPDGLWPRSSAVIALFERLARERGVGDLVPDPTPCPDPGCGRTIGDHGQVYRVGATGWQYAIALAGLEVRRGTDGLAMNAGPRPDRNRQMVTGGDLGAKRRPEHC